MSLAGEPRVFIVHADEDEGFVGELVQQLGLPPGQVQRSSQYMLGGVITEEIERAVRGARVTLLVLSPQMLAAPELRLAEQVATYFTLEERAKRVIPIVLEDCAVPLTLARLHGIDLRDRSPASWRRSLARLRGEVGDPAAPLPAEEERPCPYPGMNPFSEAQQDVFHGRRKEILELFERIRSGARELYVVGPSGSGKSSLVFAGLIPSLVKAAKVLGPYAIVKVRPGSVPIEALGSALGAAPSAEGPAISRAITQHLAREPGRERMLLVVDQLEELFATAGPRERAPFIEAVRQLRLDTRVVLLFTLRADFYGALMESSLWDDLKGVLSQLNVAPLRGEQLMEAIANPAAARGVHFERALLQQLLHDVSDEPGTLPLLQDTLVGLWIHRTGTYLRLEEYQAMSDGQRSGLAVVVARRADAALAGLRANQLALARRLFLRLVQFGEGAADTRRQQRRDALAIAGEDPAEIDAVVKHLVDSRLLTVSGGEGGADSMRIDLAHEILLTAWPQLQAWIGKHRENERRRRELENVAKRWVGNGRKDNALLVEGELAEIDQWQRTDLMRELGLSRELMDLIEASRNLGSRQAGEQAERRRNQAKNYLKGAQQALMEGEGERAASYLLAAREAGIEERSLRALFQWSRHYLPLLLIHPGAAKRVRVSPDGLRVAAAGHGSVQLRLLDGGGAPLALPHPGQVLDVAWSSDGGRLATFGDDKIVRLWDARRGEPIGPPLAHQRPIAMLAWSPDGGKLAVACHPQEVRIWEVADGSCCLLVEQRSPITAMAWRPHGERLATASEDGMVRTWNGQGRAPSPWIVHEEAVRSLAWSLDGSLLATGCRNGEARVWEAQTGKPVSPPLPHQGAVRALAWRPNCPEGEAQLATASEEKTARVWDVKSGRPVLPPLSHEGDVIAVAWSRDGARVATASADKTARIWDAHSGAPVSPWLAHSRDVVALIWSDDGRRVLTTSGDQSVRSWDAHVGASGAVTLPHRGSVRYAAWSADGSLLATASDDRHARIWRVAERAPLRPALLHELRPAGRVLMVALSPDASLLATASDDGAARLWELQRGELAAPELRHGGRVTALAFSPDGGLLATASDDGTARLWRCDSGALVEPLLEHHGAAVGALAWSPDGARLATGCEGGARIWDAGSGVPVTAALRHEGQVRALAWSPDGAQLATGGDDRKVRLWSAHRGSLVRQLGEHRREISALAWSRDGALLATASFDRTARVWRASEDQAGALELAHRGEVTALAWSPDGARLATASFDGTTRIWDPLAGYEIAPQIPHNDWVWCVAFSPDGGRLLSASEDKTAQVWEVPWREEPLEAWRAAEGRGGYRLGPGGELITREPLLRAAEDGSSGDGLAFGPREGSPLAAPAGRDPLPPPAAPNAPLIPPGGVSPLRRARAVVRRAAPALRRKRRRGRSSGPPASR